jgi:hypothetical protein
MSNRRDRFQTREKIKDLLGRDVSLAQPSASALELLTALTDDRAKPARRRFCAAVLRPPRNNGGANLAEMDQIGRDFEDARADHINRDGTSASRASPTCSGTAFPHPTLGDSGLACCRSSSIARDKSVRRQSRCFVSCRTDMCPRVFVLALADGSAGEIGKLPPCWESSRKGRSFALLPRFVMWSCPSDSRNRSSIVYRGTLFVPASRRLII